MNSRRFRDNEIKRSFGHVLREARADSGLTQEALADAAGLHRTTIGLLERGVKNPTLGTLYRLSGVLGTSPEKLVLAVSRRMR